jgi:glycogen debranching enzyme
MPPSFTLVVKTKSVFSMKKAAEYFNDLQSRLSADLANQLFGNSSLSIFNHLLFRCEQEEKDISGGSRGPYGLKNYGAMTYAGITSFMTILRDLKVTGDLGHELFDNMRQGDWYLDYTLDRLKYMERELGPVIEYLKYSYD